MKNYLNINFQSNYHECDDGRIFKLKIGKINNKYLLLKREKKYISNNLIFYIIEAM